MLTPEQLDIRNRWMEALRSGKYKQTRYKMQDSEGYCCLGVLCDVVDPDGWKASPFAGLAFLHNGNEVYPPAEVQAKAKLNYGELYGEIPDSRWLAKLNDNFQLSFEEIAEAIHLITLADMEDAD